jgi:hypothetical protein
MRVIGAPSLAHGRRVEPACSRHRQISVDVSTTVTAITAAARSFL